MRRTPTTDEGATLVFVAVILVALLALTAFAVDFGRMYEERRQLQNGADAAALAIAEDCARGLCDGAYDEYAVAETYVDVNARDGSANAWQVDLDLDAQTVTVHNRTEDPGGRQQVRHAVRRHRRLRWVHGRCQGHRGVGWARRRGGERSR